MNLKAYFLLLLMISGIANAERYDIRELRPYFSLTGEYRNSKTTDINDMLFEGKAAYFRTSIYTPDKKLVVDTIVGRGIGDDVKQHFSQFANDPIVGPDTKIADLGASQRYQHITFGFEGGVLYRGLQVGFGFNSMITQISKPNASNYTCVSCIPVANHSDSTNTFVNGNVSLWDARYHISDYELVVGYELFPEKSYFQVIPRFGFGFSSINFQMPGEFGVYWLGDDVDVRAQPYNFSKQDYAALGKTFRAEVEFRLNIFDRVGLALSSGYRWTSFDQLEIGESDNVTYFIGRQDNDSDNLFIAAKFMIILPSLYEKETGRPVRH